MNWAQPQLLMLFLLLPLAAALAWAAERRYRRRLMRWRSAARGGVWSRAFSRGLCLRLLALAAIVTALAQPRWNFTWQEVKRQGADVVIALDVSRSMSAADVSPSRLERAKREIQDLLSLSRGDRLGLVLYSGVAFIQCPLTHDLGALRLFLEQAGIDSLPVQGTSLSQALQAAGKALADGAEEGSHGQAIILISDGEDHEGEAIAVAKDLAEKNIVIHAIGVGGQGAPIPLPEGGFLKDASGELVVSRPNEAVLKEIAGVAGGQFVRAADGNFELDRIYATAIRPDLREGEHSTREKVWIERHYWLSALAAFFLLIDGLLTWKARPPLRAKSS